MRYRNLRHYRRPDLKLFCIDSEINAEARAINRARRARAASDEDTVIMCAAIVPVQSVIAQIIGEIGGAL